jgi:4-hydroxybenzoate polyprenyltransferase
MATEQGERRRDVGNHPNLATTVIRALRPHHWTKNLLLAVPLVVAQEWHNVRAVGMVSLAALCFCLVASSGYLLNDIFDLAADRRHPVKRNRPLAAGDLAISVAVCLSLALVAVALVCAVVFWQNHFWLLLLTYTLTSFAYSIYLKHCMVIDVVVLAGLYTIRILAGGASVDIPVSAWLLAFSMFFFLSLAFAKRYTEMAMTDKTGPLTDRSRPYLVSDLQMFRSAGPACGLLSVLVLALYINSEAVRVLYLWPPALWLLCPLFLYWILRVWFLTMRATTDFDPVVSALRDRTSYVVGIAAIIILLVARFHS